MKPIIKICLMTFTILCIMMNTALGEENMPTNKNIISDTKTESVILFLNGAQIEKKSSINLSQGENIFLFTKLPYRVHPESIQVQTTGDNKIISIDHKINYLEESTSTQRIEDLEKELKKTINDIKIVETEIGILQSEWDILMANKELNKNSSLTLTELKESVDFFREYMTEISYKSLEASNKKEELQKKYNALENELQGSRNKKTAVSEITVEMFASSDSESEIILNYYVDNCSWTPYYDIRIDDNNDKAIINLNAQINQNTGEDWENIDLILSTASPSIGMKEPSLYPWRLSFEMDEVIAIRENSKRASHSMQIEEILAEESVMEDDMEMSYIAPINAVIENKTSVDFIINGKVNIENSVKKTIDVTGYELDVKLKHYSIRKLDMDVFLLAVITGWENMTILPADVNIFLSSAFVGKTYINPQTIKDNLEVSLGRDKQVIVTREKNNDFKSKTAFGGSIKETRSFDITIKNLKSKPVNIEVIDQIPLSTDSTIVVSVDELSSAILDANTGKLTWDLEIAAGDTIAKKFQYTVTYPSKKRVILE